MFLNSTNFGFISILESNWLLIKKELLQLNKNQFISWQEKFLGGKGWDVFGLYAFGMPIHNNCKLCPETTRLIEMIPGVTVAGFSSLAPGTHIVPHVDYPEGILRCNLGLIAPEKSALRVGNKTISWQEGKCLIFDYTTEHEAWNYGDTNRVVLLIDFKKPDAKINDQSQVLCLAREA
jgi:aspartyl/asparaginyl beta-hydroxylase (cupin superfamily)